MANETSMERKSPQFSLKDGNWTTTAILPSWSGIHSRRDLYGAREEVLPSDGAVEIVFAPEGRGSEPLTPAEVASVAWVIENEAAISNALWESLAKDYPDQLEFYDYPLAERADMMPDIGSARDLHALTRLQAVFVHSAVKDGIPYVGFGFGCTWEQEHGLGILMHGTRPVRIGWAETAFAAWIAEEDRDSKRSADDGSMPEISTWRASVQRRKQASRNASDARQRSADLAARVGEAGGNLFPDGKFFRDAGTQFSIVGPRISEGAIDAVFPESFPGKRRFRSVLLAVQRRKPDSAGMYCLLRGRSASNFTRAPQPIETGVSFFDTVGCGR